MSSRFPALLLALGVQHDEALFGSDRLHGTPEIQRAFATLAQRHPRFFRLALAPLAQRHTAFLLALAERLPFE